MAKVCGKIAAYSTENSCLAMMSGSEGSLGCIV